MKKIKIQCPECKGTGIYVGMAERDGYSVVCSKCDGTGCVTHEYEEFTGRVKKLDISKVIQRNPGFVVGKKYEFGGMSYEDWFNGKPFPQGSEMRNFVCPHWWTHNYYNFCEGKIDGAEKYCDCPEFKNKSKCWEKYDELGGEK